MLIVKAADKPEPKLYDVREPAEHGASGYCVAKRERSRKLKAMGAKGSTAVNVQLRLN